MIGLKSRIYGISTLYWMLFIYGFSSETGNVSGGKSMKIAGFIEELFRKIFGESFSYQREDLIFEISHIIRKSAHVMGFLILAVLVFLLVESISEKKKRLLPIVFTVLFAAADEFHQSFVPGRGPSINDVGIDACGAIVGVMLAFLILSGMRKKNRLKISSKGMII